MLIDDVGDILVTKYGDEQGFVSAYSANSQKVFKAVISLMKVVPIDLKSMLEATYRKLITVPPDSYIA